MLHLTAGQDQFSHHIHTHINPVDWSFMQDVNTCYGWHFYYFRPWPFIVWLLFIEHPDYDSTSCLTPPTPSMCVCVWYAILKDYNSTLKNIFFWCFAYVFCWLCKSHSALILVSEILHCINNHYYAHGSWKYNFTHTHNAHVYIQTYTHIQTHTHTHTGSS